MFIWLSETPLRFANDNLNTAYDDIVFGRLCCWEIGFYVLFSMAEASVHAFANRLIMPQHVLFAS